MNLQHQINELRQKEKSFRDMADGYGEAARILEHVQRYGHPTAIAFANGSGSANGHTNSNGYPSSNGAVTPTKHPKSQTTVTCSRCGTVPSHLPNPQLCPQCKRYLPGKSPTPHRTCTNCGRVKVGAADIEHCPKCSKPFFGLELPQGEVPVESSQPPDQGGE